MARKVQALEDLEAVAPGAGGCLPAHISQDHEAERWEYQSYVLFLSPHQPRSKLHIFKVTPPPPDTLKVVPHLCLEMHQSSEVSKSNHHNLQDSGVCTGTSDCGSGPGLGLGSEGSKLQIEFCFHKEIG